LSVIVIILPSEKKAAVLPVSRRKRLKSAVLIDLGTLVYRISAARYMQEAVTFN
jgi:hypothetical protein